MREYNKYYFFYKHRLSQWHMVDFYDKNGVKYNCCEQFMMASKALLFNDLESYKKIMATRNQKEQQDFGRAIKNFDQKVWDSQKYGIVKRGNLHRFTQSVPCRELLLSTKGTLLVEASPVDSVWGVKLSADNPLIQDPKNWRGQNLLGKALTEVREILEEPTDDFSKFFD